MFDVSGPWYKRGDPLQQCAIFQAGIVVLLINESGAMAKARFSDRARPNLLILDHSPEWHVSHGGLYGEVSADGRRIDWPGGDFWSR
jgi:hypothetical protein